VPQKPTTKIRLTTFTKAPLAESQPQTRIHSLSLRCRPCAAARQRKESLLFSEVFKEEPNENETSRTFNDDSGVAWWLWTVRTINASNDRYIVAQFTNGTSQEPGGANATLDLTVFNDIRNLSYPNHFIQWIQVTVPAGFTGSGAGGAFVSSDFIPPSGWSVSSIAGNVITFISASTNYTFNAGQSRTFLLKVHTPQPPPARGRPTRFQFSATSRPMAVMETPTNTDRCSARHSCGHQLCYSYLHSSKFRPTE